MARHFPHQYKRRSRYDARGIILIASLGVCIAFCKTQVWRPATSRFVDLLHVSLILSEKENAGEPQWLRVQHFARKVLETP